MRNIRLLFYFVIGLMLGGFTASAFASTFPAVAVYKMVSIPALASSTYPSLASACSAVSALAGETFVPNPNGSNSCCAGGSCAMVAVEYTCPYGGSVIGNTCTNVPPCDPPAVQDQMTGECVVNNCPLAGTGTGTNEVGFSPAFPNLYGWYDPVATTTRGGAGSYCSSGCTVSYQATVCVQSTEPGTNNCAALNTTYTGSTCTGTAAPIVSGSTAKPPCAAGEGVVTMGGKVACVPTGASPDTPKVTKSSSTQTFPDGSTKITNTTTTCSGVGACSTTTTITNTAATSGGNAGGAGQAGDPGTTTDEEDESGDTSEFCAKNPSLQVCKGGLSEEGTQKQVLTEVKKLTSVDSATDKSAITNTKSYTSTEGYEAAKAKDDELLNFANGTTKNASVEASKTTFEQALASGFWTDIPTASCTTPSYVIAGHEIEWSRWCEIVGYIQEIGAYGMWIMLAISVFVMLTGGRQS